MQREKEPNLKKKLLKLNDSKPCKFLTIITKLANYLSQNEFYLFVFDENILQLNKSGIFRIIFFNFSNFVFVF